MDLETTHPLDITESDNNDQIEIDELIDLPPGEVSEREDLIKVYLRDMGKIPLLDKDMEIKLSQQIETGHQQVQEATLTTRLAIAEVRKLLYKIIIAKKRASDLIDMRVSSNSHT